MDLKEYTRLKSFSFPDGAVWDPEKITLSCLMRIADAVEAMAKNYTQLQDDAAPPGSPKGRQYQNPK